MSVSSLFSSATIKKVDKVIPPSIKADQMNTELVVADLRVGAVLKYRGDSVPFVQATHLISKGKKTGKYLLPALREDDTMPKGGEWIDIPGNTKDPYIITKIDTNRIGKGGKPLPDLIWISGGGYESDIKFGLNPHDVIAKFLKGDSAVSLDNVQNKDVIAAVEAKKASIASLEKIRAEGW